MDQETAQWVGGIGDDLHPKLTAFGLLPQRQAATQKPGGWIDTNQRTTFEKLVRRAGLTAWPRLFQAQRASRETDLMQDHPIRVVTAWIGNTPKIALGHYLQTLDADFEKAVRGGAESGAVVVQNPVQSGADGSSQQLTERPQSLVGEGLRSFVSDPDGYCRSVQMAKVGLERNPILQ